jgi:probable DNA metabolism protein
VLEHEGSFAGFLCAVAEYLNAMAAGAAQESLVLRAASHPATLFEERLQVARDDERAERLWTRFRARAGEEAARTLLEAFCSDVEGAGEATALLIARIWRLGPRALDDLGDGAARLVEKAANRARREAHRITGLIRFVELRDGSLFATIDPDCDLLILIGDHFAERFPALRWVIRDERRAEALLHEPGLGWTLVSGLELARDEGEGLPVSRSEEAIVALWRRYHATIAIGERRNLRLQSSFMPKKYWKNLPETGASASSGSASS